LEYRPVVPIPERKKRTALLRALSNEKRYEFDKRFEDSVRPVLFEVQRDNKWVSGWTDNYLRVRLPTALTRENTVQNVKLVGYQPTEQIFYGKPA
jgi:threonylcarbamoyladenosine tRNA methylthiotransferase MtaB